MPTRTPANPAAAEAIGSSIPFEFDGEHYTILNSAEWSFDALDALEQNRMATFLREVLGEGSLEKFKATKPKMTDAGRLAKTALEAVGIRGN
jgi:hypothetical protein